MTPPRFEIRLAGVSDAARIAAHRARMFQDMGLVPEPLFETYRVGCETRIGEMRETGEYIGRLASPNDSPDQIAGGAGVQLRRTLPHPVGEPGKDITVAEGRHAIIINVFTEPEWRRRGVAKLLINEIIAWARRERLDRLVLHASDEGPGALRPDGFRPEQ